MPTRRMEAFSDGVIAILITVMVLELRIPHGTTWSALRDSLPLLLTYLLSFVYLGIYWNNHHHLLMLTERVSGATLWANLHLLFWLSLIPFTTGWMGENHFTSAPSALYGFVLLMASIAYWILQHSIIVAEGPECALKEAIGRDWKGKASPTLYLLAILCAWWQPAVSETIYALVALMWLIPDRRIERVVAKE